MKCLGCRGEVATRCQQLCKQTQQRCPVTSPDKSNVNRECLRLPSLDCASVMKIVVTRKSFGVQGIIFETLGLLARSLTGGDGGVLGCCSPHLFPAPPPPFPGGARPGSRLFSAALGRGRRFAIGQRGGKRARLPPIGPPQVWRGEDRAAFISATSPFRASVCHRAPAPSNHAHARTPPTPTPIRARKTAREQESLTFCHSGTEGGPQVETPPARPHPG